MSAGGPSGLSPARSPSPCSASAAAPRRWRRPGWREAYRLLLQHAVFVGLRDQETLAAAHAIRRTRSGFPIRSWPKRCCGPDAPADLEARGLDAVLIPRAPNGAADQRALDGLLDLAWTATQAGLSVVVAALEPATDRPALLDEGGSVHRELEELLALCRRSRMVISARLHGVIAGTRLRLRRAWPGAAKTGTLMARLGVG